MTAPAQRPMGTGVPGTEQELHDFVMPFGKHRGERLVHVPVSYLRWMVGSSIKHADLAERELIRRGTTVPTLEVSGHAIDRASILCRYFWHQERTKKGADHQEGIHAWLVRKAAEAWALRPATAPEGEGQGQKIVHDGIKFTFAFDGKWPVLLTVRPAKKKPLDGVYQNVGKSGHADTPASNQ